MTFLTMYKASIFCLDVLVVDTMHLELCLDDFCNREYEISIDQYLCVILMHGMALGSNANDPSARSRRTWRK